MPLINPSKLLPVELDLVPGADVGVQLNAALTSLAATVGNGIGGQLCINKGLFTTSVKIVVPNKVSLIGQGRRATILQANSSFPTNSSTVTITNASPGVISWTTHPFVAGDPVYFSTVGGGTLPTEIVAGTIYYVISGGLTANAFEVSATLRGAAINTSGGSGTVTAIAFTPIVQLGDGSSGVFDTYVQDLWIDANQRPATQGLMSMDAQEGSGARHVLMSGMLGTGLFLRQGGGSHANGNNFFEDVEISNSNNSDYLFRADGGNFFMNKGSFIGNGIGNTTAGVLLYNTLASGAGWHFEAATTGLYIEGANNSGGVTGIDAGGAADVTNLVYADAGGPSQLALRGLYKNAATNIYVNASSAITITDSFMPDTKDFGLYGNSFNQFTVSLTGSPFTWKNTKQRNVLYCVQGGTVSSITMGRYSSEINLGITNGCWIAAPGDGGVLTYSSAPTMTGFPL